MPHPLREGQQLAVLDLAAATQALAAAGRGATLQRVAYVPGPADAEPPASTTNGELATALQQAEQRLTRYLAGQSRQAGGRGWLWLLIGAALTLLWINLAALVGVLVGILSGWQFVGVLIGTLGASLGGPVLAVVVALLPALWAWRRAAPHFGRAGRLARLQRLLRSQRGRADPLTMRALPALHEFVTAAGPEVNRLREQVDQHAAQPLPAGAAFTESAQALGQLARRHHLPAVGEVYQQLALCSGQLEQRVGQLERRGGIFDERRSHREVRGTRGRFFGLLAPFELGFPPADHHEAIPAAVIAGGLILAGAVFLAGAYVVPADQVVVLDHPEDRLERLVVGLGLVSPQPNPQVEIMQRPGVHLSWPRPFGGRQLVPLTAQPLVLQAIVRADDGPQYGVAVLAQYRIVDVARWVRQGRSGNDDPAALLNAGLSQGLQDYLEVRRGDAVAFVLEQNPQLQDNRPLLAQRADLLLRASMDDLVQSFFVEAVGLEFLGETFGIVLGPEFLVRFVEAPTADGG